MTRTLLIAAAALSLASGPADAGPIRARIAARRCGQVARPVAFPGPAAPAASAPVSSCANGRCVPAGFGTLPTGR